jgi:hypothetical protein
VKSAVTTAALAAVLFTAPADAACKFDIRYDRGTLRWNRIPGATQYRIVESFARVTNNYTTDEPFVAVTDRASSEIKVRYVVTAELDPRLLALGEMTVDACSGSLETTLDRDPAFRRLTRKAVLPIVGSSSGAGGARFRTGLTLRGEPSQRGRIVFHPAGRAAADDDPSIRYGFAESGTLTFDDVVAAIGQSGTGSLDIIPDDDAVGRVPQITAYLYNDTPGGTFGTFVPPVFPFDYLHATSHSLTIPDPRFRTNIGFRMLADGTFRVAVFNNAGRLMAFHDETYPAGWMQLSSAADLARTTLNPGDSVTLLFPEGAMIAFHTFTENRTNDATLVVGSPRSERGNVEEYVD